MRRPSAVLVVPALVLVQWVVVVATASAADAGALGVVGGLVLAAPGVVLVHLLGTRTAGPGFGLASAAVFVGLPVVALRFFSAGYRDEYVDHGLAVAVGVRDTRLLAFALVLAVVAAVLPARAAAAAGVAGGLAGLAVWGVDRSGFSGVRVGLHENAWSIGFVEWLPLAGTLGLVLRSPLRALAVAGWSAAVVLHAVHEPFAGAAVWRALVPAWPALAVVVAGVGLLVPPLRERRAAPAPS